MGECKQRVVVVTSSVPFGKSMSTLCSKLFMAVRPRAFWAINLSKCVKKLNTTFFSESFSVCGFIAVIYRFVFNEHGTLLSEERCYSRISKPDTSLKAFIEMQCICIQYS